MNESKLKETKSIKFRYKLKELKKTPNQLNIFKKNLTVIDTSFLYISNCSLFNNVPNKKPLDSLVLFRNKNKTCSIFDSMIQNQT